MEAASRGVSRTTRPGRFNGVGARDGHESKYKARVASVRVEHRSSHLMPPTDARLQSTMFTAASFDATYGCMPAGE